MSPDVALRGKSDHRNALQIIVNGHLMTHLKKYCSTENFFKFNTDEHQPCTVCSAHTKFIFRPFADINIVLIVCCAQEIKNMSSVNYCQKTTIMQQVSK